VSTFDDETQLEFFEEPETVESPGRQRRRIRPPRAGGPRRPAPPPGAVALARLAGFVALAIAVVVGLVFWVGSCQGKSKHAEYASYMNDVRPIAQRSAGAGTQFASALGSANLTLASLRSRLGQWSQQQQQGYDEALRLRPPGPLQSAHQEVLAALQLRAIGFAGLANALAAAGTTSSTDLSNKLAAQAQLLSSSDIVWRELFHLPATQTMKSLGVRGVTAPPSEVVSNPEVVTPQSFGLVLQRLNATTSSGHVSGLHGSELNSTEAVTGTTTKTLSTSSPTTIDVAPNLVFNVTFTNSGNFEEVKVPVTFTVTVFGKVALTKKKVVPSILKGKTATVSFGNLNLPNSVFGASATVHVSVGKVPGEVNTANNSASYPVFFSLPSGH
jgi:hypothetical protein